MVKDTAIQLTNGDQGNHFWEGRKSHGGN